mmetsp:Transcript_9549/g.13909  ORF Transcript_9549/g.13909 Transcript_9549/m.13909 type:complete len:127 (-) Transcript_9549:186-566(-)
MPCSCVGAYFRSNGRSAISTNAFRNTSRRRNSCRQPRQKLDFEEKETTSTIRTRTSRRAPRSATRSASASDIGIMTKASRLNKLAELDTWLVVSHMLLQSASTVAFGISGGGTGGGEHCITLLVAK